MKRIALVVLLMTLAAAVFGQSAGSILVSSGTGGNISADLFSDDWDD